MKSSSPWYYIPLPNPEATLRLICFSYAGGSASTFIPYAKMLDKNVELVAIQLPGRGARFREPLYFSLSHLITDLVEALKPILNKPYVVFGHSFGARIAYELCLHQLQGKLLPLHFIGSGCRAVHLDREVPPIYNLPDDKFLEKLKIAGGTSREILNNQELMNLLVPMLRADFEMAETHKATTQHCFPFTATFLHGTADEGVSLESVLEWQRHFTKKITLASVAGGHFFVDECRDQVTAQLNIILEQVFNENIAGENRFKTLVVA
jgi:medium-chain acyl-[acyl-carrier-protein] hydrolase